MSATILSSLVIARGFVVRENLIQITEAFHFHIQPLIYHRVYKQCQSGIQHSGEAEYRYTGTLHLSRHDHSHLTPDETADHADRSHPHPIGEWDLVPHSVLQHVGGGRYKRQYRGGASRHLV